MDNKEKLVVIDFFKQLLDVYEFELYISNNFENEPVFMLNDMQGGNLGGIEQDTFLTLSDVLERLDVYHNDYIYRSLEEREYANETILKNDWDLTAKRFIESKFINKILSQVSATEYNDLQNYLPNFDIDETLKILDKEEQFCKTVCQKYINTMSKEILLEKNNKILHIFIEDEYIKLKEDGKINIDNYQDYLDKNFEIHEYDFYKELFDGTIKDEIAYDLNDLELFDKNGKWNFYISFDELREIGYGFMVKDNYHLIEEYAVSDEKIFDFFDYFSLEELDFFEHSLDLYFNARDIIYNQEYDSLESKENYNFNKRIIRLACGLITYDDFIEDYKENPLTHYDISLSKVIEYFRENQIKDLMNYGNDSDEGLTPISSLYKEIMNKLNIKYTDVYTEDISDGKYLTTITFEDNFQIQLDTSAWNGIKVVTENIESIYEKLTKLKENNNKIELENELSY